MNSNKQEETEANTSNLGLFLLWSAGSLFTLGLIGANKIFSSIALLLWYEKLLAIFIYYVAWPYFLGTHFHK